MLLENFPKIIPDNSECLAQITIYDDNYTTDFKE